MKATEQSFPMELFLTLYKVVVTFAPVDEILVWPFKLMNATKQPVLLFVSHNMNLGYWEEWHHADNYAYLMVVGYSSMLYK